MDPTWHRVRVPCLGLGGQWLVLVLSTIFFICMKYCMKFIYKIFVRMSVIFRDESNNGN